MDVDTLLGALVVAGAALLISLTSACTAAGLLGSRIHPRPVDGRTPPRPDALQQFASERQRVVSELVMARIFWQIVGFAAAFSLMTPRTGVSFAPVLILAAAAVVTDAVLESVPRLLVARDPERWTPIVHPVTEALRAIFLVPAYLTDLPAHAVLKLPALQPENAPPDRDEELVRLVEMEESAGGIEEDEREMIRAVFELEDTAVREVMVPRIDVTAVPATATLSDVADVIAVRGYSRIPLYGENLDDVLGVIYAKDVLAQLAHGNTGTELKSIARPAYFVPETKHINELLTELRSQRVHIAIAVDEYGGTAGLVTIEDIVEEIVGDIEDEYDHAEPTVVRTDEGGAVVDARESVYVLKDLFNVEIEAEDFDTIGGLVIHRLGRIPAVNESVEVDGLKLRVLSVVGRRVRKVQITPAPAVSPAAANA